MKNKILMLLLCALTSVGFGAFVENFDTFSAGALVAQNNWEAHAGFVVEATANSGLYVGGMALRSTTYNDKTTRHIDAGVSFGLNPTTSDGVEFGFDVREDITTLANIRMYLRNGATANYSPSFGFNSGVLAIRTVGEGGTTISGSNLSSSAMYGEGTEADPGYWLKGEWLRFKIVLTGENFDIATVYAYNLTRGGLEIPTGLIDIQLGVNPQSKMAGMNRINVRGGSTSTLFDNVYVTDYVVPEPATLAMLGLGGLLIRRKRA